MKTCPNCHGQVNDDATFCGNCGAQFTAAGATQQQYQAPNQQQYQAPQYQPAAPSPYDHTAEFDAKDISENKVFAMSCYLLSIAGVIIALLASHKSEYAMFHVRQALKFILCDILMGIIIALLAWTVIVPIVGGIAMLVLLVIRIISFFQVCSGKACEPAILRSLGFLR